MDPSPVDVAFGAAIVAVAGYLAVKLVKAVNKLFGWIGGTIRNWLMGMFAEAASKAVAPDLAHLGHGIRTSVDELRVANASEHTEVQRRLGDVESRLHDVESRLASVETHLTVRSPETRTRIDDKES